MKTKGGKGFSKIDESIDLYLLIEKHVAKIQISSENNLIDIDNSIHEIRKSLKAILAILLLYKTPSSLSQYLQWKTYFRNLLKQFAASRESYVYIQTLCHIEGELTDFGNSYLEEIRNNLESNYTSLVSENKNLKLKRKELHEIFNTLSLAINSSFKNCNFKLLKENHKYTFQMTHRLFKRLTLKSSSEEYHKFRKWCIYYHLQQTALNEIGLEKMSPEKEHKFHKLTDCLGNEHDLQIFHEYLRFNFKDKSEKLEPFFLLKINRLREKALSLYPRILS